MPLPPKANNPFWPLPADYDTLTKDGQRMARIGLMRSWYDPMKPDPLIADPEAFVYAFRFFREYYRKRSQSSGYKYFYADAPMHQEWPVHIANHRHTILTAFRGCGKSMFFGEELPEFLVVSRAYTPVQYATAAQDLADDQIRAVMIDLENNDLLFEDFGVLKSKRPLKWSSDVLELPNGSSYIGLSSEEAMRGKKQVSLRAFFQILDDPEVDKRVKAPTLRSNFQDWLQFVFWPMGEMFAWRVWSNTLLAPNAAAMRAMRGEIPEFNGWFKIRYDAATEDASGTLRSAWPAKFSDDEIESLASGGNERVVGFGKAAWATEMMNNPTSRAGLAFDYDPERHNFKIRGPKHQRYLIDVKTGLAEPWKNFLKRSVIVVGVDLSMGKKSSDPQAIVVSAFDNTNTMWILDCWHGLAPIVQVLYHSLDLCQKWGAKGLGIERVAFESVAIDVLRNEAVRRQSMGMKIPQIVELLRGGAAPKEIRIMGLQFRFVEDKIKILEQRWPELEDQVCKFTIHGAGTSHDDILDAMVACQEVVRMLPGIIQEGEPDTSNRPIVRQAIEDGVMVNPLDSGFSVTEMREMKRKKMRDESSEDLRLFVDMDFTGEGSIFHGDLFDEEGNQYNGTSRIRDLFNKPGDESDPFDG